MTNNSPFDDHIKKQFGNYKPEVPPHIWENIMDNKEKRRPAGFLFSLRGNRMMLILSILICTVIGSLLIYNMNKPKNGKNNSMNGSVLNDKIPVADQDYSSINNNTESADNIGKDAKSNNISGNNSSPENTKVVPSVSKSDEPNNSIVPENETRSTSTSIPNRRKNDKIDGNGDKNGSISHKTGQKTKEGKMNVAGQNNNNQEDLQSSNKGNRSKTVSGKSKVSIANPNAEGFNTEQTISKDATATVINNTDAHLNKHYLDLKTETVEKEFSFQVTELKLQPLNIPCPASEKNSSGRNRYFEIYGGPDYAIRTFEDTANSAYLQKRKESTHVNSAFSVGIRYTKVYDNGINFKTGINYSQVNETFNFEQGHMIQYVYMIDANGDTTGSYATTGTRYKTTYNKYRTIDIPLVIGYEMGKGRLRTNINGGLVLNVYSWQKGDLLDSAYQPVNITTGKSNSPYQFKTNVGLGFTAGASFYYRLNGRLHVLAEPYFRYNFSSANKADITLKQKFTTVGLRLGLRIDF